MPWETVDMGDLTQEQRNLLRDVMRHGSMSGVPSRTYSRLDLSRLQAFEDPNSLSDLDLDLDLSTEDLFDMSERGIEEATRRYVERQEAAILGTEWDDYDIVDIVEWSPVTPSDLPEFEVHRYRNTAPPVSTYATGEQRYSVTRVTRPLLVRIFEELREADALPERYEPYAEDLNL